jgi:hypothetical protein
MAFMHIYAQNFKEKEACPKTQASNDPTVGISLDSSHCPSCSFLESLRN